MCCGGNYDGLEAAMAAPSQGGVMARLFTTVPGSALQIGNFGVASNKSDDNPGLIVPESVGKEFEKAEGFRVEWDADEAPKKKPAKGKE